MPYSTEKMGEEGIWRVTYRGEVDGAERRKALAEGVEEVLDETLTGILIDFREAIWVASEVEKYEFGGEKSDEPALRGVRIAVLHLAGDGDAHRMMETVARNRGLSIRSFDDEAEAMDWLRRE